MFWLIYRYYKPRAVKTASY